MTPNSQINRPLNQIRISEGQTVACLQVLCEDDDDDEQMHI